MISAASEGRTREHPSRRRLPIADRARTETLRRFSQKKLAQLAAEEPDDGARRLPLTRGECMDGPRPCPLTSCRFHLYLDVTPSGSVKINFPTLQPEQLEASCALDLADQGGLTLEETADYLNLTRERVRQLEQDALDKLRRRRVQLRECL